MSNQNQNNSSGCSGCVSLIVILGLGIMALPYIFNFLGIILIIFLIIFGVMMIFSSTSSESTSNSIKYNQQKANNYNNPSSYRKTASNLESVTKLSKFQKQFKVAGVSYRENEVRNALNFLSVNTLGFNEYKSYTDEEIRTHAMKVLKYKDLVSKEIKLIPEPENIYDSKAVKVVIGNKYHIGYVPKEVNEEIFNYLTSKNDNSYTCQLEVVGGPLKRYDFSKGKVVTDSNLNIGFKINLIIEESNKDDTIDVQNKNYLNHYNKRKTYNYTEDENAYRDAISNTESLEYFDGDGESGDWFDANR